MAESIRYFRYICLFCRSKMLFKALSTPEERTVKKCCKQCKKYNHITLGLEGFACTPLSPEEAHHERLGDNNFARKNYVI